MTMSAREAEEAAFKEHDAPSWEDDPVARDAAVRWHLRGFQAGAQWARGAQGEPSDAQDDSERRAAYRREHRAELMRQERAALRAAWESR